MLFKEMSAEIYLQIVLPPEESMAYWACMYGFVSWPTAKNAEIEREYQILWPPPPAYNFKLNQLKISRKWPDEAEPEYTN